MFTEDSYDNKELYEKVSCECAEGWSYLLMLWDKKKNKLMVVCRRCWQPKGYLERV